MSQQRINNINNCKTKTLTIEVIDVTVTAQQTEEIATAIKENHAIRHLSISVAGGEISQLDQLIQAVPGDIVKLDLSLAALPPKTLEVFSSSLGNKTITGTLILAGLEFEQSNFTGLLNFIKEKFCGYLLVINIKKMLQQDKYPFVKALCDILLQKSNLMYFTLQGLMLGDDEVCHIFRNCSARTCNIDSEIKAEFTLGHAADNPHIKQISVGLNSQFAAEFSSKPLSNKLKSLWRLHVKYLKNGTLEQKSYSDADEGPFLIQLYLFWLNFVGENSEKLTLNADELIKYFNILKEEPSHKRFPLLSDDYHKAMFAYHLRNADAEAGVKAFLNIKNKDQRDLAMLDQLIVELMEQGSSNPSTAQQKRAWQLVLLCTLEVSDNTFFSSIKITALNTLLTGKGELVNDSSKYLSTILQTNPRAKIILQEVGFLRIQFIKDPLLLDLSTESTVDEFWQDASDPKKLMQMQFMKIQQLTSQVEELRQQMTDNQAQIKKLFDLIKQPAEKIPSEIELSSESLIGKLGMFNL